MLIDLGEAQSVGEFTIADLGEECAPAQIKRHAADNAAALNERWTTILAWVYDTTGDDGGAAETGLTTPTARFEAGMRRKRARMVHAETARLRVEAAQRENRRFARAEEEERKKRESQQKRRRDLENLRNRDFDSDGYDKEAKDDGFEL